MASERIAGATRKSTQSTSQLITADGTLNGCYLVGVLQLEEYKRRRLELEQRLSVIAEQKRQLEANVGHYD